MESERDQVFLCYSRKDDRWRQRIQTTLAPLLRNGTVKAWDDTQILPGEPWLERIEEALRRTRVALVLASADALASDFIVNKELPAFDEAARKGDLTLLWVPVRDCLWQVTALERYQAVLDPKQPLAAMSPSNQDTAIAQICWKVEQAFRLPPARGTAATTSSVASGGTNNTSPAVESIIRDSITRRLAALAEDHAAATRQLGETIDAVQRGRIERQIAGIEADMRALNPCAPDTAACGPRLGAAGTAYQASPGPVSA